MVSTLIIDLDENYMNKNISILKKLAVGYTVIINKTACGNQLMKESPAGKKNLQDMLVLSDDENAAVKWSGYAILAIAHGKYIPGVEYAAEELEHVEDHYINYVYNRRFGIPNIIKETERLIIREMKAEDADGLCRLYQDEESTQFIPKIHEPEEERKLASAYIKNMYGFYGYGMWAVVRKKDNCLIGRAGIENRMIQEEMFYEIGYFIGREYQRMGYGYEAVRAVMEFAGDFGMQELIAYINAKNTPSIRLARKSGFHFWKKLHDVDEYVVYRKQLLSV